MIALDVHSKINFHESNSNKWRVNRDEKSDDPMVLHLESVGWKQRHSYSSRFIMVQSDMPGFTSGRFTAYIRPLGRNVRGHKYRLVVEWTPYHNNDYRFNGYFNTAEELESIITGIDPRLIIKNI